MKFILAEELKKEFYVRAKFYKLVYDSNNIIPCRSVLEIIRIDKKEDILKENKNPNAIFIMMNPGSSEPKDKNYNIPEVKQSDISICKDLEFVETNPDVTQYQIMRIMKAQKWDYVKIINLSDYREADSSEFYQKIKEFDLIDKKHLNSIFSKERDKEFNDLLNNEENIKVIVVWGISEELENLIKIAITKSQLDKRIGLWKGEGNIYYYHPCPRIVEDRKKWLEDINKIIQSHYIFL